jgi:hypothetical protein
MFLQQIDILVFSFCTYLLSNAIKYSLAITGVEFLAYVASYLLGCCNKTQTVWWAMIIVILLYPIENTTYIIWSCKIYLVTCIHIPSVKKIIHLHPSILKTEKTWYVSNVNQGWSICAHLCIHMFLFFKKKKQAWITTPSYYLKGNPSTNWCYKQNNRAAPPIHN